MGLRLPEHVRLKRHVLQVGTPLRADTILSVAESLVGTTQIVALRLDLDEIYALPAFDEYVGPHKQVLTSDCCLKHRNARLLES